jgi:hypothetical protein
MAYIIKGTSGLLNTRLTDTGRQKLSKGKFNISYFQIGDSEVCYSAISGYNLSNNFVLEPAYNYQNSTQQPETNKMGIKYPFYVDYSSGSTPSQITGYTCPSPYTYNETNGFCQRCTPVWTCPVGQTFYPDSSAYAINGTPGYCCSNCGTGQSGFTDCAPTLEQICNDYPDINPIPSITVVSTGNTYGLPIEASQAASVYNIAAPRGFFTGFTGYWTAQTESAYTINSNYYIDTCLCNNNTIVLSADSCSSTTGTPSVGDYVTIYFDGVKSCGDITGSYPILTYKIEFINGNTITLDRQLPNFIDSQCCGDARVYIYPSGMTALYDQLTPQGYYAPSVINFATICEFSDIDVKVWNMNIPWSTSPAGVISSISEDYTKYASAAYLGTKEYLGYQETSGQTFWVDYYYSAETTDSYYYNSFDNIIKVYPNEQKAIAIVHYTNNEIDTFYGEKFAMNPYDTSSLDNTGAARNFKISIPWLMWHKSDANVMGETFYVDPAVGGENYFQVKYMQSTKNTNMNNPGLRYYHLWDTYLNSDGNPSRVGKVFPDLKMVVFDDEEIVAALSYKSDRNWTLPAPSLSLITPNVCELNQNDYGALADDTEYMYVTYRFNSSGLTSPLHCNYYSKIQGPKQDCNLLRQNVAVRFGNEFGFLTCSCFSGYSATEFKILAQIVTGSTTQPAPDAWVEIDFTTQLTDDLINGYIPSSALTANTFVITYDDYWAAPIYDLSQYISLPLPTGETSKLNFGDEYYFYGNVETAIEATIYELKFLCNLASTQFVNSSNPTWTPGSNAYITEVGLFDSDKDLLLITKLQSPILRQGTQQFTVKLDL